MFKEVESWLVTMLDLILIITCFFVLSYAININKLEGQSKIFGDSALKANRLINATSLEIINSNLITIYQKNVELLKSEGVVRLLTEVSQDSDRSIDNIAESISTHLYNFQKNPIRVSLLVNYKAFSDTISTKGYDIKIALRKLIEDSVNFRNLLAKNTNNDKITTIIDLHSSYPSIKGKDALIVVDICGPN